MAKLLVALPGQPEAVHVFKGNTVTIGRLPDNDIPLPDRSVSGHHAKFFQVGSTWHVTDLDSLNKTWLNGSAVREAPLIGEAPLRFGSVVCTFFAEKPSGAELDGKVSAKRSGPKEAVPAPKEGAPAPAAGPAHSGNDLAERVKHLQTVRNELAERAGKLEADRAENQTQVAAVLAESLQQLDGVRAERDKLSKDLAELAAQLEAGRAEQAKLSEKIAEGKRLFDEAAAERGTLRKQLEDVTAHRKAAEEKIAEVTSEKTAVSEQLSRIEQECQAAKADLDAAKAEIVSARKERDDIANAKLLEEERSESLEQDLNRANEMHAAASDQIVALERELKLADQEKQDFAARLESEAKQAAAQLALRHDEAQTLTTERDQFRKQFEDATAQRKAAEEKIAEVASEKTAVSEQLSRIEKECQSAKADLDATKAELATLRKERDGIAKAKAADEKRIESLEQDLGKAQAGQAEANKQVATLERDLKQAGQDKQDLAARIDAEAKQAAAQLALRQDETQTVTAERDELRKQLEEAAAQRKAAEARIAEVASDSSAAGKQLRRIEKEYQSAKADLDAARAELAALRKERDGMARAKAAEEKRIESLEQDLGKAQAGQTETSKQVADLERDLKQAGQDKQDLEARLEAEAKQAAAQLALRQDEAQTVAAERDELRKQLEEAVAQRKAAEERIAEVASDSSAAGKQLSRITKDYQGAKADLDAAKVELAALRKERDEIAKAKAAEEKRAESIEQDLGKAKAGQAATNEQLAALERDLKLAREEKLDLAARLEAELKQAAEHAKERGESGEIARRLKEAQAQIAELQAEHAKRPAEFPGSRHAENGSGKPGPSPRDVTPRQVPQQRTVPMVATLAKTNRDPGAAAKVSPAAKPSRPKSPLTRQALHKAGVEGVATMRGFIHNLIQNRGDENCLRDFVGQVRGLMDNHAGLQEYEPILRLAGRLDALASDLIEDPRRLGPRMLRSLIQGVDTLSLLFDTSVRKRASGVVKRVVMIGSDESECAPLVEALRETEFEPGFAPTLADGLKSARDGGASLACLDAPRLGGLNRALADSLKQASPPSGLPLLLLAEKSPVAEWSHWSDSGVSDFLQMPIHPLEFALKSLALVYLASMADA